jgi:pimeloyl-ACP methyl ester carboxylesterase
VPLCHGIRYFEQYSRGVAHPPVVLIHGAGASHLAWPGVLRRLDGQRIIAPDLPGHGGSAAKACGSIRQYAERLLEFLDDLGIYRAALAGHSMGAAIALEMARLAPAQVPALVLLSAGLGPPSSPRLIRLIDQPFEAEMVRQILLDSFFSPATPTSAREKALGRFGPEQARRFLLDYRISLEYENSVENLSPGMPVLVLAGADDTVIKPASARALASSGWNARYSCFENAGHMLPLERADALAAMLGEYFNTCFALFDAPGMTHPLASKINLDLS